MKVELSGSMVKSASFTIIEQKIGLITLITQDNWRKWTTYGVYGNKLCYYWLQESDDHLKDTYVNFVAENEFERELLSELKWVRHEHPKEITILILPRVLLNG